jgi:hypothetical protein
VAAGSAFEICLAFVAAAVPSRTIGLEKLGR